MRIIYGIILLMTFNFTIMAQTEYTIEIDISSDPKNTWIALTNFSEYPLWNSVLRMSNNDDLQLNQEFNVTILQPDGKKSQFKAKTISLDPKKSFSAQQLILGEWFFSATHFFIIDEAKADHVRFVQKWVLTGIVSKLFKKQILKHLAHFKQMNNDLKVYLEASIIKIDNQFTTKTNH